MSSKTPEELVQSQLDAYNARDIEAFLLPFHADVQILEHPSGELIMRGHDEMRKHYGLLFATNPDMHCQIVNRTIFGNFVIDLEHLTGRVGRSDFQALAIYQVEGDLIKRVWFVKE